MLSKKEISRIAEKAGIKVTFNPNKTDFVDKDGNNLGNYDFSAFPSYHSYKSNFHHIITITNINKNRFKTEDSLFDDTDKLLEASLNLESFDKYSNGTTISLGSNYKNQSRISHSSEFAS